MSREAWGDPRNQQISQASLASDPGDDGCHAGSNTLDPPPGRWQGLGWAHRLFLWGWWPAGC